MCSVMPNEVKSFFLQDDVLLEVEDLYYLLLKLPESVNEDTAAAVFNKKKQRLTLTVCILWLLRLCREINENLENDWFSGEWAWTLRSVFLSKENLNMALIRAAP